MVDRGHRLRSGMEWGEETRRGQAGEDMMRI